jgi:dTDP-4-dehydrorhamnose 3,5-epimerase
VRGAVLDIAVDLRKGSPTYREWVTVELSADNKKQFFIPRGFGHAFLTLAEGSEFVYKADNYYDATADRSIRYDDPDIGVSWPMKDMILSDKDRNAPLLRDSDCSFVYARRR